jgi:ribonuclease I
VSYEAKIILEAAERDFWQKVDVKEPGECWPWNLSLRWDGYGYSRLKKITKYAVPCPRIAFFLVHGYWPRNALHLPVDSHNPACCNPLHIYDGTHTDNMQDRTADGTEAWRRLSPDHEAAIRQRHAAGNVSQRQLAREYGVTPPTIRLTLQRTGNSVRS